MKKILNSLLAFTLISTPMLMSAQGSQYMCTGIVKECIVNKKDGYVFNQQSKSGAFMQGDTAEITIVVYKNMDYRISACCPDYEEYGGQLKFKITETVKKAKWVTKTVKETVVETREIPGQYDDDGEPMTEDVEKVVEKQVKKRIYVKEKIERFNGFTAEKIVDKHGNELNDFTFISDKTRKLTIEVYIPEVSGESGDLEADQIVCIGLLIEHRPAPQNIGKFMK